MEDVLWGVALSEGGDRLAVAGSMGELHLLAQAAPKGAAQVRQGAHQMRSRCVVRLRPPADADAGADAGAGGEVHVALGKAAAREAKPLAAGVPDEMALRCVGWNPNPAHRHWVACAGPAGLVACVRCPDASNLCA